MGGSIADKRMHTLAQITPSLIDDCNRVVLQPSLRRTPSVARGQRQSGRPRGVGSGQFAQQTGQGVPLKTDRNHFVAGFGQPGFTDPILRPARHDDQNRLVALSVFYVAAIGHCLAVILWTYCPADTQQRSVQWICHDNRPADSQDCVTTGSDSHRADIVPVTL